MTDIDLLALLDRMPLNLTGADIRLFRDAAIHAERQAIREAVHAMPYQGECGEATRREVIVLIDGRPV